MSQSSVDDILEHYGKKGMKWGVRNDRPSGSSSPARATRTTTTTTVPVRSTSARVAVAKARTAPAPKKKAPDGLLSDAELRQRINRIKMDREYASLLQDQTFKGRAQKVVKEIAGNVVKGAVTNVAQRLLTEVLSNQVRVANVSIKKWKSNNFPKKP